MRRRGRRRGSGGRDGRGLRLGSAVFGLGRPYPLAVRMRAVEEVLGGKLSSGQLSAVIGVGADTVAKWIKLFQLGGVDALVPESKVPPARRRRLATEARREAVVAAKQEHPEYGTRRIRDELARLEALGVSETEVRRILHEQGLLAARKPAPVREPPERRFERAGAVAA
ncbi:MAG: helix-turn-helix domain-containing protein [Deltaproteobacteria bacterium]|nr:helix-turn-helix domain-containing protein [Deltaproteobacteria bacterium]